MIPGLTKEALARGSYSKETRQALKAIRANAGKGFGGQALQSVGRGIVNAPKNVIKGLDAVGRKVMGDPKTLRPAKYVTVPGSVTAKNPQGLKTTSSRWGGRKAQTMGSRLFSRVMWVPFIAGEAAGTIRTQARKMRQPRQMGL